MGHLCARDLEDLSMLTMSREKDSHVHICVDAQTGLGTRVPGLSCSNTILLQIITVLTRCSSIVFELICSRNACNFTWRRFFGINFKLSLKNPSPETFL